MSIIKNKRKRLQIALPELPLSIEEALNRLRINVKFCGKDTKKILVTSSVPNEGKSFVSVQLWRLLAEAGSKTVIVDLDIRNSMTSKRLEIKCIDNEGNETEEPVEGIDYYLSGQIEYDDVVYKTNIENGDFVPCTNLLENPSSLFEDRRFEELLTKLASEYRYVILDSPPLVNVADSEQIATMCDGAIVVVRSGHTSRKLIRQSLKQLERAGCSLLGMVLNRENNQGKGYGKYGKYGGYGYGYGYGHYGKNNK
ncbi:MAG: CpsD/CapB family tyrosine-protein kinase [Firmicutes bacterium]|nr:CpsD/CapB family tyrosine-protein kinase [Bacillota bacterium]